MPTKSSRFYSPTQPPSLSMSELVCKTLDHDATDVLIDKWLEHRNDAYWDWFMHVRERRHSALHALKRGEQLLAWSKGDFVPENIFMRTVDTARLIPLDRTWTTHVYHHRSMQDRKLSMMPVVFTMLPELMLLRGMHDHGCDDIFIIVTDMKRAEMDAATEYFKFVCQYTFGRAVKQDTEREIHYRHARLKHTLEHQRRTPCFPQIDLIFRAILYERRPPFIVLFSHQTTSYSQIFFTHPLFVPAAEIFFDFPSGCPNPCCTEDCEMIRFPRHGLDGAAVLPLKRGRRRGSFRRVRAREMCNWIDCDVAFSGNVPVGEASSKCSSSTNGKGSMDTVRPAVRGQVCSKCKLVRYCSAEHQRKDWEEHRRLCVKPVQIENTDV
ncbi:hypothetical protein DFH94DRAFT_627293 [Russula ochroleuca]|uniref:MYND-type domain-containing protein n=1 Tax=Russula ochroleuca TaxID=152965 RepID=A0A9P5MZA5_9AGAM|nr:hypothetical protein DFH94DRAFT_627293 [Russula ochroleuca]